MSTCKTRAVLAFAVLAAAVPSFPEQAAAQPSAQDQATARTLFNEARDLMKAGRYPEACGKLESASRLYEGSGLLLNLGDCYERVGRTASAWTEFGAAFTAAERAGRMDDIAEAQRRQTALERKLSRLVIRITAEAPGMVVRRDGTELARGAWGEAVPVDPGEHTVIAEAAGRTGWTGKANVTEPGSTVVVEVPALAASPTGTPARTRSMDSATGESPLPAPRPYWTGRRIASASLAAVGVLGIGAGGLLGLVAKLDDNSAEVETTNRHADSTSAARLGDAATAVVCAGAALTAAGLVLWLTAPDETIHVGATPAGLFVAGSF
jgi:hypothetical protein